MVETSQSNGIMNFDSTSGIGSGSVNSTYGIYGVYLTVSQWLVTNDRDNFTLYSIGWRYSFSLWC